MVVVGRVLGWDVLGRAVWAETEPRSVAEPYIENLANKELYTRETIKNFL